MEIYAVLNQFDDSSRDMKEIAIRLAFIENKFRRLSNSIDWDIKSKAAVARYINTVINNINAAEAVSNRHYSYLKETKRTYMRVERETRGESTIIKNDLYGGKNNLKLNFREIIDKLKKGLRLSDIIRDIEVEEKNHSIIGETEKESLMDLVFEIAKGAGYFGSIISVTKDTYDAIHGYATGDPLGKYIASGVKTVSKGIKDLIKMSKASKNIGKISRAVGTGNAKAMWRDRVVGFNNSFSGNASKAASFGNRFKRNFGLSLKDSVKNFTFKNGVASGALSWLGVACDGIINYYDNQEEMRTEGISQKRAWEETISETVIDVGKGILVGAAVTAGLTAAIGSAPVLAVAAGTAIVTVGADYATKKLTKLFTGKEKDFTEFVSDGILDIKDKAVEGVNYVKEGFNKATGALANATGKALSKWGAAFGF